MKHLSSLVLLGLCWANLGVLAHEDADSWVPTAYPDAAAHAPSPLPDRIILTWNSDPATTQAVNWRTDSSVLRGLAEIAEANVSGRDLEPLQVQAETSELKSDLNEAHYHTVEFTGLKPDTLYTYRVGDGENWSEFFHFKTACAEPAPFSFVYFGDSQNEIKTRPVPRFSRGFPRCPPCGVHPPRRRPGEQGAIRYVLG